MGVINRHTVASLDRTLYWNVPCWGHQLWDINCRMCVCVSVCLSVRRHIAILRQEWFNGLSWNCVGMLGRDDATNVSNFGYEPIKFSSLKLMKWF